MSKSNVNEMDNSKPAIIPTSPQGEPGDIDIFVFSNGEAQTPPRKYHLTVHDLDVWDSTINFLARAHYGRLQSPITLYTINGKKIESPLELANNSTYVAVANKDTFIPGGYDKYLMKASKSWIKRYGPVPSSTSHDGKVISDGNTLNNGLPEEVTEQLVMNKIEENTAEVIATALANGDLNNINENPKTINLPINNDVQKQGDKQKTTTRSSTPVLRKNINNKNHINSKYKPPTPSPLKKRPGSPPTKNSVIKAISAPGKPKYTTSQMANKNNAMPGSNIGPEFIASAKVTSKAETPIQSKPIANGIKKLEQDIDQFAEDEKFLKQFFPPHLDSISKREVSTKEYADKKGDEKTDTLQTTRENVDGYTEPTGNKLLNDDSALTKSFSTEMKRGEVINLRLRIEVKQGEKKDNKENKSAPIMDMELCNLIIKEESSQVNIDEVVFEKQALTDIFEEFQINKPDQKYLILHCDCCNNYYRQAVKMNESNKNQSDTIKRVRNNKDYIVLLPYAYMNRDDDLSGCKCVEAVSKLDKIVQTSMIFETTELAKVAPRLRTDDQSTETPIISMDSVSHSCDCLCDRACETSELPSENKVSSTLPPSNEFRNINAQYCTNSNSPRTPEMMYIGNTKVSYCPSPPEENPIVPTNCLVCTKPRGQMLDKATQTDSFCFLMEIRRQSDGHYSFHLPPLHMVKLYNY